MIFSKYTKMPAACKRGTIRRVGYSTKSSPKRKSYSVKSTCVKDTGMPGKTPKAKRVLPKLKKGKLGVFGYHDIRQKTVAARHSALGKAIKAEGKNKVLKRLVVIANYNKNNSLGEILRRDVEWIKGQ